MPAVASSPIHPVLDQLVAAVDEHRVCGTDLLGALSGVPDPRARRGVRHQVTTILGLALCAVLAGARSFTAIGEWVANASPGMLAALGSGGCPPCESTLRRTLQRLGGDELDAAIGDWAAGHTTQPGGRRGLALDGKTLRGARGTGGRARHLMAAIDHHAGVVLGQVNVHGKTNEIPMFSQLCHQIDDLGGVVVTADAMHCQKAHADYLVLQRGAHYILTVKGNQPALRNQLKALPWKDIPIGHTSTNRGHGRAEKRTLKVVAVSAGIVFPHAIQAIQVTRRQTRKLNGKKWFRPRLVYAVTSLTASQATGRTRGLDPRPLVHREPPALGPRRHLRRGPLPGPHRQRPPRHGLPAQPRHQHRAPGRRQQHRPSPTASRLGPAQTRSTTPDQLRWDFAGALATSDLDILVFVGGPPAPFRETTRHAGWIVELFVHTPASYLRFIEREISERRSPLLHMCGEGRLLIDGDGFGATVQGQAGHLIEAGHPAAD